ncbi:carbohydrate diacid regulator [Clostridium grantii DSM 8605]|uniref:Carbohydrate diacid regulator n=2 Tax=Clostridium TaxID=1485 RepID=A0A1M5UYL0_9CLOT|nr:carbohydrate diacid regulator [Clostridium grantii DSM 8605]
MLLNRNDVQKIVNRVVSILGKNINIMDQNGIIIGSGDELRVNDYHEAAKISAQEKREIIVTEENKNLYKGSQPGVNIPIYHNNQVQGVVGITGEKAETQGYGQLVKELVELMISEIEQKKTEQFKVRAMEEFAKELIKENSEEDVEILKWRAQLVGFDLKQERRVILCDIINFKEAIEDLKSKDSLESLDSFKIDIKEEQKKTLVMPQDTLEIKIQKLKQKVIELIQSLSNRKFDLVFNLYQDRFVILTSSKENPLEYCERIRNKVMKNTKLDLVMGIGDKCSHINEYNKSFNLGISLLRVGTGTDYFLESSLKLDKKIFGYNDYSMYLLYENIAKTTKDIYLKEYRKLFYDMTNNTSIKELLATVKVYFLNDMSIKITSDKMFIHRNTIIYRFKKLKDNYDIDVTNSYECMKLYTGIIIYELEQLQQN